MKARWPFLAAFALTVLPILGWMIAQDTTERIMEIVNDRAVHASIQSAPSDESSFGESDDPQHEREWETGRRVMILGMVGIVIGGGGLLIAVFLALAGFSLSRTRSERLTPR